MHVALTMRAELPKIVKEAVIERGWSPNYTRHLRTGNLRWSNTITLENHWHVKVLYIDIHNHRTDQGALNAIARLKGMTCHWRIAKFGTISSAFEDMCQDHQIHLVIVSQ